MPRLLVVPTTMMMHADHVLSMTLHDDDALTAGMMLFSDTTSMWHTMVSVSAPGHSVMSAVHHGQAHHSHISTALVLAHGQY